MPLGLWRQALVEILKYQFDKNGTKRPARERGQLGIGDRGDRVLGKPNDLPWVPLLKEEYWGDLCQGSNQGWERAGPGP